MKKHILFKRVVSVLLICMLMLPCLLLHSSAAQTFNSKKTAVQNGDGTYRITFEAFQTGKVEPTDVVMVLDVSGSMEYNTPVAVSDIDNAKDYYVRYVHLVTDGTYIYAKQDNIKVHNTAPAGQEPTWYGTFVPGSEAVRVYPGAEDNLTESTFVFYTGAMDELRRSAAEFVQSIAENAQTYDADHRVAVVEFSSPTQKNASSRNTHSNPYYANILSGDGTASGALVSAKDQESTLRNVFANLTASGPTYSDDALAQAEAILKDGSSSDRSRMVVLFTDGGPGSYGWLHDTDSSALATANAAIASAGRMKADGVTIYTIGVFNDDDLYGDVGEKNATYLNAVSSNYPNAASMESTGEKTADAYCTVGSLKMDLSGVFGDISEVIGVPIESAYVSDTVSKYFYLTAAQKQALTAAYPGTTITENADGTTTIELRDISFLPVAANSDGSAVDPDNENIFKMSFDVTPRAEYIGGQAYSTNTGMCGVFTADGAQLAQFEVPSVEVPVSEKALGDLIQLTDKTFYEGDTIQPANLYVPKTMDGVDKITYSVKDEKGNVFTGGTLSGTRTFTVVAAVQIGGKIYTKEKTITIVAVPNEVVGVALTKNPTKRNYFVGDSVDISGIAANAVMQNGKTEPIDTKELTVTPAVLTTAGTQYVTVEYMGLTTTFPVAVEAVKPVRAEVVTLPTQTTYVYRKAPTFTGLTVKVICNNGTEKVVNDLSEMQIRPASDVRVRRGAQKYNVTVDGVTVSFNMQVKLVWWQWLILILLFGWIWY